MPRFYQQQVNEIDTIRLENIQSKGSKSEFSFSISQHAGMNTQQPAQLLGDQPYATSALNVIPEISRIIKAHGAEAVGQWCDIDPRTNHRNMIVGTVDIPRNGTYYYTIVQESTLNDQGFYPSSFYLLEPGEDGEYSGCWQKRNPILPDGSEYRFRGVDFDIVQYKSLLFLASGEEALTKAGPNGVTTTSGLLNLDLTTLEWQPIPTGKAAKVDLSSIASSIEQAGKDGQTFYDSLEDFNPSILEVYKDRLLISGSEANPFQVKVSEHYNPKNFVDGVLGYTVTPLNGEDRRRASTFFTNQPVTSMHVLGDNTYIGTKNRFYTYNLIELSDNYELDRLAEDYSSVSGPVSNKGVKVALGQMFYGSDYQVTPELNSRALTNDSNRNNTTIASAPQKISYFMDEYFKTVDISNSTVGIYENSVLWSFADSCASTDYNGKKINNRTLYYARIGDTPVYAIWDHIKANYFAEIGRRGLMYSSASDGLVYRINTDINVIDPKINDQDGVSIISDYPSIIQSSITGVGSKDSMFSGKKLTRVWLLGGFANDTIIKLQVFPVGSTNCEGEENCCLEPLFEKTFGVTDACGRDCDENCQNQILPDINYYKNIRYFKKVIPIPQDTFGRRYYTQLYFRFTIVNSSDFYIMSYGGSYELTSAGSIDESLILDCGDGSSDIETDMYDESGERVIVSECEDCMV